MYRDFDCDSRNVLFHSQLAILEIMDGNNWVAIISVYLRALRR